MREALFLAYFSHFQKVLGSAVERRRNILEKDINFENFGKFKMPSSKMLPADLFEDPKDSNLKILPPICIICSWFAALSSNHNTI
jgi:hypothetical protein